jgi:oligogalacturonide transport system permease protein
MGGSKKNLFIIHLLLSLFGLLMIYPLLWLVASSFKSNNEIFMNIIRLLPKHPVWNTYIEGWKGIGQFGFGTFFFNSFLIAVPVALLMVISAMIVGYGFARFAFTGKWFVFGIVIATMMLPDSVLLIPRYIMFTKFGWVNSYKPFIVPAAFASNSFFIFLAVQFIRGIPYEIDESAVIDGCGTFMIFLNFILPLSKPAMFSICMFQFLWQWNDFFNVLIYINSVSKFTIPLGLRLSMDAGSEMIRWNELLAMTSLSIAPIVLLFFVAQRYFVEGIATTGLKG